MRFWSAESSMCNTPKTVIAYCNDAGEEPFTEWLYRLRDRQNRYRILHRLRRLESGNYGDYKSVGGGVNELRFFFGSGYRVYFGEDGGKLVILLCGGGKSSQSKDIRMAQVYWKDYLRYGRLPNIG